MKPANTANGEIGLTNPKITPNAKTVRSTLPISPSQAARIIAPALTSRFGFSTRAAKNAFGTTAAAPPSNVDAATTSPNVSHSSTARAELTPACASNVNGTKRWTSIDAASYCAELVQRAYRLAQLGRSGIEAACVSRPGGILSSRQPLFNARKARAPYGHLMCARMPSSSSRP